MASHKRNGHPARAIAAATSSPSASTRYPAAAGAAMAVWSACGHAARRGEPKASAGNRVRKTLINLPVKRRLTLAVEFQADEFGGVAELRLGLVVRFNFGSFHALRTYGIIL